MSDSQGANRRRAARVKVCACAGSSLLRPVQACIWPRLTLTQPGVVAIRSNTYGLALLVAQRDHGIELHGAASGRVAGPKANRRKKERRRPVRERIGGAD